MSLPPSALGDFVWIDSNGNGKQDAGETGLAGVTVTLFDCATGLQAKDIDDNLVLPIVTGLSGAYNFINLAAGDYYVKFEAPSGYIFTQQLTVVPDAAGNDSDAGTGGVTGCVTLDWAETELRVDAGLYMPASLGDRLWTDSNANGVQDTGETGIVGQTVTLIGGGADGLINGVGDTTVTTTTGTDGIYGFTGLTPGVEYQVMFDKPAGTVFTGQDLGGDDKDSDVDTATGKTQIVTLISGENNPTLDAGVYAPAALGDKVFEDKNGNGQQDGSEPGIPNATVRLYTCVGGVLGTLVATTTTDANGLYSFTGLKPGDYLVEFITPAGYTQTTANVGADATDSDAGVGGLTGCYTLTSGQTDNTVDAGFYQGASLGDRLWTDSNANGVQDAGEAGIVGQTVTLIGGGADGLISTAGDNTSTTTTTGADGIYGFTGLTPGVEYQVMFDKPAGSVFTGQDLGGDDTKDSDVDTATGKTQIVTLVSGENNPTLDAGVISTPDIHLEKDVSPSPVAANVPVTYTYTVTNPGGPALANVTVIDNNATPGVPGDDFNPTPTLQTSGPYIGKNIGDTDGDNLLDVGEAWKYTATLIPTVTMYVTTSTGTVYASGTLTYTTLGNGDIRVTYLQANAINDNTYGTGSDAGWAAIGKVHKFSDLTGSDKAGFLVKYSDGTTLAQFYQDYITLGGTNTEGYAAFSGYQSLGFSGGDGSFVAGNSAVLKDFDSTLELNLNRTGYTTTIVNSPVGDPNWNNVNGYSFVIDHTAFTAGKSFGGVTIFDQHNSPAKVGTTNSLIPYVVGGPVTNIAVASGTGGGSTVSDSDDATVQILGTPRKFYTVDPGTDKIYGYTAGGGLIATNSQQAGNTDAYGITGNAAGTKLWVLDLDKSVNVYNTNGVALGQWTATDIGATPEGIALDGNDLWMLDRATRAIKWYDDAALRTSGTDTAEKSFILPSTVNKAKGITTDGTTLWVVEDDSANVVFRYTIVRDGAGTPTGLTAAGSWTLNSKNATPTGITLDPTNASQSLWVVDSGTDTVYEYGNGRGTTSGAGFLVKTFKLGSGNTNAQDIFDPEANFGIASDTAYVDLSAWRDTDGSHQTDTVESMSPAGAGIVSPDLSDLANTLMDASAYLHLEPGSVALSGGQVADMTGAGVAVAANDAVAVDAPGVLEPGWLFG